MTCLSLSGEELWRWVCPLQVNCPALAWDDEASEWLGVLNHVNNERPDTLVRWSADGSVVSEHPLGLVTEYAFLPGGRHLVTSDGAVRETCDHRFDPVEAEVADRTPNPRARSWWQRLRRR